MIYCSNKAVGVYAILNTLNQFVYVGSTTNPRGGIKERVSRHLRELKKGTHHSTILQKHFDRYGEEIFEVLVLETCLPDEARALEQFWLDLIGIGSDNKSYNICHKADLAPSWKGRKHKPETIAKMIRWNLENPISQDVIRRSAEIVAEANSLEFICTSPDGIEYRIKNLSAFCRKYNLCDTRMNAAARGTAISHQGWLCRYGYETKEEQEARIRAMPSIANKKQYILTSPVGEEYVTDNLTKCCNELGIGDLVSALATVAQGKRRIASGWFCRYLNEPEEIRLKRLALKDRNGDYVITDPEGNTHYVHGLVDFCAERNLCASTIAKVCRGKAFQHKGEKKSRINWTAVSQPTRYANRYPQKTAVQFIPFPCYG
jgi:group I intron endonuclease